MSTSIYFGNSHTENTGTQGGDRPKTPPEPFSNVPFDRDPDFVGREALLEKINQKCSKPSSKLAVVGFGGVGKSKMVVEYCYRVREKAPDTFVFWCHASNVVRFEQSYHQIAERCKITRNQGSSADLMRPVLNWLQDPKHKWVLVLDNVDDDSFLHERRYSDNGPGSSMLPVRAFIPTNTSGSIIMTTRRKAVAERFVNDKFHIQVQPMNNADAQMPLEAKLGGNLGTEDKEAATKLLELLDLIPLAIIQAAAYIKQRSPLFSIQKYIEEFERNDSLRFKLLAHEANNYDRDWEASNSVLITWQLSFNQIKETRMSAANLLALMSFFDRHAIPERLLRIPDEPRHSKATKWLTGLKGAVGRAMDADAKISFPRIPNKTALKLKGILLWKIFCEAEDLSKEGLTASEKLHGQDHPVTITILSNMVHVYVLQGRLEEAEAIGARAVEVRKKTLGLKDQLSLTSTGNLIFVYHLRGKWKKSEELGEELLATRTRILGPNHPDTVASKSNLALSYHSLGRFSDAERLAEEALNYWREVAPLQNLYHIQAMMNLATAYGSRGRLSESEAMLKDGLIICEKYSALGPRHPTTLNFMHNLAWVLHLLRHSEESMNLQEKVVRIRKEDLRPAHPDTLKSMSNLAVFYGEGGQLAEGETLAYQVLEAQRRTLGESHPATPRSLQNIACMQMEQGKKSDAIENLAECIDIRNRILPKDHWQSQLGRELLKSWLTES
ncbi:hypothetical protein N7468_002244 [Penicillium chermesinum]|uniref:NB-ARC domain-containing protein n=1 Tax=Penicillium chermesinum TaxID=63820 RepID=A0A9W9PI54_9EURO|nr:uncharacterized protein N7468_002244 [Penicillium chermesinum]KAJ5247261.1 hypothetical protein N7468_002244 [Penicillium chermesinum]